MALRPPPKEGCDTAFLVLQAPLRVSKTLGVCVRASHLNVCSHGVLVSAMLRQVASKSAVRSGAFLSVFFFAHK